jgi:hypothetical protein
MGIVQEMLGSGGRADKAVTVAEPSVPRACHAASGKSNRMHATGKLFDPPTIEEAHQENLKNS